MTHIYNYNNNLNSRMLIASLVDSDDDSAVVRKEKKTVKSSMVQAVSDTVYYSI